MRTTNTDDLLFPVELKPLYFNEASGVRGVRHRAVVDQERGEVLGVVGNGYRLVTNEEALEFGRECAAKLFEIGLGDLEIFNIEVPGKRSYCRVDLVHKGFEVNIMRSEVYLPFLRLTNSYNATRALRFDIGFCRKLCLNGVIFEHEAVEFRFPHSRNGMTRRPDFRVSSERLNKLTAKLESDTERLYACRVPASDALPLTAKILDLPCIRSEESGGRGQAMVESLRPHVVALAEKYISQMGENAYAVWNAATDIASRPPKVKGFRRSSHSMQVRAGAWPREFVAAILGPEKIGEYVQDFRLAGWN